METEIRSVRQLHADVIASEKSLSQFSSLLDSCFSVPPGGRYFDDFPVWNERFGVYPLLRIGVFEGETLVSSGAIRLASLKTQVYGSEVSVALIGAVATDPKWRGMGLASRTVEIAVQWAKERGACLVLLWSSEPRLYRRLGFEPCGRQARVPLENLNLEECPAVPIYEGWNSKLFKLIQKRQTGLVLTDKDHSWYEAHQNVRWLSAGFSPDQPTAYVAVGRGIDLKDVIHDWGGDKESLFSILRYLQMKKEDLSLLCSPTLHGQWFNGMSLRESIEPLCWAKVLDPGRLVSGYYPSLCGEGSIQMRQQEGMWNLFFGNQISGPHTGQELAKLILGSPSSDEKKRSSLFPVPLWVWGLDAA